MTPEWLFCEIFFNYNMDSQVELNSFEKMEFSQRLFISRNMEELTNFAFSLLLKAGLHYDERTCGCHYV